MQIDHIIYDNFANYIRTIDSNKLYFVRINRNIFDLNTNYAVLLLSHFVTIR